MRAQKFCNDHKRTSHLSFDFLHPSSIRRPNDLCEAFVFATPKQPTPNTQAESYQNSRVPTAAATAMAIKPVDPLE